ncbi:MAG TPA: helix-turn-helix domain-containing protein [Anaerolineales bacterium]|nr:helix-turn-helix domain-containing protein [Anaerolineales bacterium]HNA90374.1 helix-turn-helix domain-containing protein [Anaerolineales bacterium]HNC09684.1 helix-turn-helix domain-containing protein [Anaerolineales bacterium]
MDRFEFGVLIAMLREDMEWTQSELAEYSNLDTAIISQIERGVKKHFDPELLFCLANSFHLTTIERREFFLAASGINEKRLIRQPSAALATDTVSAEKVLRKMLTIIEAQRLPAFIMDVYSDVLALNYIALGFFQVPSEIISTASSLPGGYSTVRMMFGKELALRSKITDNWDHYAIGSMRFVRENSLRYRAKPYFQYLLNAFRNPNEFPLFTRYWRLVSSFEQDREANVDVFSYTHSDFGPLSYATSTTVSITPHGELFLNQYIPLDDPTREIFENIATNMGYGVVAPLAPWPHKKMP